MFSTRVRFLAWRGSNSPTLGVLFCRQCSVNLIPGLSLSFLTLLHQGEGIYQIVKSKDQLSLLDSVPPSSREEATYKKPSKENSTLIHLCNWPTSGGQSKMLSMSVSMDLISNKGDIWCCICKYFVSISDFFSEFRG